MNNQKVVAITGASSGMGQASAKLFSENGWTVYGGARHLEGIPSNPNIHALHLDVTDSESNKNFIETIIKNEGPNLKLKCNTQNKQKGHEDLYL